MAKQRNATNYKRLDKNKESDSSGEETELFIKRKSPTKEIPCILKDVEEGDTLQALAIRYCCTIEDLKRLNNIHKENEIFAKRSIKVPHRPFTEALVGVHLSGKNTLDSPTGQLIDIDTDTVNFKLTDPISSISNDKKVDEVNQIIFNSNISQKPNEIPVCEEIGSLNEEVCLLPQNNQISEAEIVSKIDCSGADCDISWIALIVCVAIVIVVVPLIYVFYIAEHPDQYHHHDHQHHQVS